MIYYLTVEGTHGATDEKIWDALDSPFTKFLTVQDCTQLVTNPLKRYMWSTALDGVDGSNTVWDSAGRALAHYIAPPLAPETYLVAPKDTYIIAHSHGGNVVAYACGKYGLKINGLITVSTPIRNDLHDMYQLAKQNINRHLHIHGGWKDYWQVFGALFDGRFGLHRDHPCADRNEKAPGGHGSMLNDPKYFPLWLERGWLKYWIDAL